MRRHRSPHRPSRHRSPAPSRLVLEPLEPRALLAVTTGDDSALAPAPVGDEPAFVVTTMTTATDEVAPWLAHAAQAATGTLVMRLVTTAPTEGRADPMPRIDLIQATFNAGLNPGAAAPAAGAAALTEPEINGVVFPGPGVEVGPTETWPLSLEAFEAYLPTAGAGPQEFYAVLESGSDVALGLLAFVLPLSSDPAFAMEGPSADGAAPGSLLAGLGIGDAGGSSTTGDPADLMAMAFLAMLAGLGGLEGLAAGPGVALRNDTGSSDSDRVTRDPRLTVDAEPGARVQYSIDGGSTWRRSFRARPGDNSVQVRTVAGRRPPSPATEFAFTLDRRPPAVPRPALATGSGPATVAGVSDTGLLDVANLEPDATVEYSVNGGRWTADYVPLEGRNVVRVRQTDVAGNVSRPSRPFAFRLGTSPQGPSPAGDGPQRALQAGFALLGLERSDFGPATEVGTTSSQRHRPGRAS